MHCPAKFIGDADRSKLAHPSHDTFEGRGTSPAAIYLFHRLINCRNKMETDITAKIITIFL